MWCYGELSVLSTFYLFFFRDIRSIMLWLTVRYNNTQLNFCPGQVWSSGSDPCGCPQGHLRSHERLPDRPRHAVLPSGGGRLLGYETSGSDRSEREWIQFGWQHVGRWPGQSKKVTSMVTSCHGNHWPFVRGIHRSTVDSPHKRSVMWVLCVLIVVSLNKMLKHGPVPIDLRRNDANLTSL